MYRKILLGPDMYHVYDYSPFYANIRQNAQTRVKVFLQGAALCRLRERGTARS